LEAQIKAAIHVKTHGALKALLLESRDVLVTLLDKELGALRALRDVLIVVVVVAWVLTVLKVICWCFDRLNCDGQGCVRHIGSQV
jgi:hypothetical protein